MKRIAVLSSSYPPLGDGGITSAHFNLAGALRRQGHEVRSFTFLDRPFHHSTEEVVRRGIPAPIRQIVTRTSNLFLRLKGEQGYLYQFAYDLTGALGGLLLLPSIRAFRPDIIIVPDRGAPSAFWPLMPGSKILFLSHHNPLRFVDNPLIGELSVKDARLAVNIESLGLGKAHAVVCPSSYMKTVFAGAYRFTGKTMVIPNVADAEFISSIPASSSLRAELGLSREAPVIYIPSAGSRIKGRAFVPEIIRRIAAAHKRELGFYLSGHLDHELRHLIACLPENARAYSPGHMPYTETIATVKECDLCVSPTLLESFGMALLEAAFCGIPLVCFDAGGNRDLVRNGETGFLVPALDVDALIERSLHCLENSAMHASMSKRVKDLVSREFSPEHIIGAYEDLFEELER